MYRAEIRAQCVVRRDTLLEGFVSGSTMYEGLRCIPVRVAACCGLVQRTAIPGVTSQLGKEVLGCEARKFPRDLVIGYPKLRGHAARPERSLTISDKRRDLCAELRSKEGLGKLPDSLADPSGLDARLHLQDLRSRKAGI